MSFRASRNLLKYQFVGHVIAVADHVLQGLMEPPKIQGGSDKSGPISMLHRRVKKIFFNNFFRQNRLSCLSKHNYKQTVTFQQR
jgi:hypothetical protein